MTKKLRICLAVVFLSSAALALTPALNIYVNGSPWDGINDISMSDIITVELIDTNPTIPFPLSDVELVISEGDYEAGSYEEYGFLSIDNLDIVSPVGEGFKLSGSATTIIGVTQFIDSNTIFRFDFHVPNDATYEDVINIEMISGVYGNQNMGDDPAFDVTLLIGIPEPMSIALLGLGGLMLRRKRKHL